MSFNQHEEQEPIEINEITQQIVDAVILSLCPEAGHIMPTVVFWVATFFFPSDEAFLPLLSIVFPLSLDFRMVK